MSDDQQFKNFHRALCERFGYCHDEKDWQRDQLSLIEHIAAQLPTPGKQPFLYTMKCDPETQQPLEDWVGSDLEQAARFEVHRAFNGVVVRGAYDIRRDTTSGDQVLVFQNPEHLWSWIQHWLSETTVAK
jgi:hypothetical protein